MHMEAEILPVGSAGHGKHTHHDVWNNSGQCANACPSAEGYFTVHKWRTLLQVEAIQIFPKERHCIVEIFLSWYFAPYKYEVWEVNHAAALSLQ